MAEILSGRVCPMDQRPLLPQDEIVCCNKCGTLHHRRCWQEHRHCTTLDCLGSPERVVVALETTVDIRQLNHQLDEIRGILSKTNRRIDQVVAAEREAAAEAVKDLAHAVRASMADQKAEGARILAALQDVILRIRALDYSISRHRFPPQEGPSTAPRARSQATVEDGRP